MNARSRAWATVVTALLCAAPVPGDVGACGQPVKLLDASRFFQSKKVVDCRRCRSCSIQTEACTTACDPTVLADAAFPDGCVPVVHDGEVCLRALLYASCTDYRGYVNDERPQVPTECSFCPEGGP